MKQVFFAYTQYRNICVLDLDLLTLTFTEFIFCIFNSAGCEEGKGGGRLFYKEHRRPKERQMLSLNILVICSFDLCLPSKSIN